MFKTYVSLLSGHASYIGTRRVALKWYKTWNTLRTAVESNMISIQLSPKYEASISMDYSWMNCDITLKIIECRRQQGKFMFRYSHCCRHFGRQVSVFWRKFLPSSSVQTHALRMKAESFHKTAISSKTSTGRRILQNSNFIILHKQKIKSLVQLIRKDFCRALCKHY